MRRGLSRLASAGVRSSLERRGGRRRYRARRAGASARRALSRARVTSSAMIRRKARSSKSVNAPSPLAGSRSQVATSPSADAVRKPRRRSKPAPPQLKLASRPTSARAPPSRASRPKPDPPRTRNPKSMSTSPPRTRTPSRTRRMTRLTRTMWAGDGRRTRRTSLRCSCRRKRKGGSRRTCATGRRTLPTTARTSSPTPESRRARSRIAPTRVGVAATVRQPRKHRAAVRSAKPARSRRGACRSRLTISRLKNARGSRESWLGMTEAERTRPEPGASERASLAWRCQCGWAVSS